MRSEINSKKIVIKKTFHRDSTTVLDPHNSELARREKASSRVYEEAKKHPFSEVYSKQYPDKNNHSG